MLLFISGGSGDEDTHAIGSTKMGSGDASSHPPTRKAPALDVAHFALIITALVFEWSMAMYCTPTPLLNFIPVGNFPRGLKPKCSLYCGLGLVVPFPSAGWCFTT